MIKFLHSFTTVESKIDNRLIGSTSIFKRFSKLDHQLSLILFANEIWNNCFTYVLSLCFSRNPFKFCFPMGIFLAFSLVDKASEIDLKPFNESLVRINDVDSMAIRRVNVETAFSVNDSSKISFLRFRPHQDSCLNLFSLKLINYDINFFKVQLQRLSGEDAVNAYAIVRTTSKDLEKGLTRPSAYVKIGHKSNRFWRMTEDQLSRDALAASASSYTCSGGTNGDSPTNLSLSDIDEVTTGLLSNDAWMILDRQIGEDRFGTAPVREAYIAMGHTNLSKDLNNINNFTPKWNYPNQSGAKIGAEWGCVNNVRFFLSSQGLIRPFASLLGASVYSIFVQGLEAVGCVYQDNFSARILYRGPEFSDALYQNVTIGYTMAEVTRVLNDLWVTQMLATLNT